MQSLTPARSVSFTVVVTSTSGPPAWPLLNWGGKSSKTQKSCISSAYNTSVSTLQTCMGFDSSEILWMWYIETEAPTIIPTQRPPARGLRRCRATDDVGSDSEYFFRTSFKSDELTHLIHSRLLTVKVHNTWDQASKTRSISNLV